MTVFAYPEYSNFDDSWFSRLPKGWGVVSLKWLCRVYSGGTPDKSREEFWADGTIPWLNSGAVNDSRIREPSAFITEEAFANSSAKWIPAGSLVIALAGQGKTKGTVARVMFQSTCNQSMAALVPGDSIEADYLYWWLSSSYQRIRNMAGGDLRDGLNLELIKSIPCPVPTRPEQSAISGFLERETAKIDALIAEQERLLALLAEKRRAIISRAVTKGLNPDAKMKDSGVQWLGEVPAHWEVKAIKWLSPVFRGASPRPIDDPKYFDESGEFAWVRIADSSASDGVLRETTQRLSELGSSLSVKLNPGQLFVSIAGTVGKPCIAGIKCCIHDGFVYFPRLQIRPEFLYRVFEDGACYAGLGKMGTQLNLNTDTIGSIRIGVPPDEEIDAILAFIAGLSRGTDLLREEIKKGVSLLVERRSALIAAAVTGHIDVREFA